jgi:hypothetical protein
MVANVPWNEPVERWSDRMIERGLKNLMEGDEREWFPTFTDTVVQEATKRGIEGD